ncbi:MAG: 30S ribosomal protein S9 [Gammaproteobacteria bacterium]|nr:30S ribosomal protein S9 [Gammaproteobacteria bacterium]
MMHKSYGTGRRKTSSARVYLNEGTGTIKINSRKLDDFIKSKSLRSYLMAPLEKSQLDKKVDLKITVSGGGQSGQVGAIVHGVTRALIKYQNDLLPILRREGFVTRDARKVERKKVGLRKARKATQFSKR